MTAWRAEDWSPAEFEGRERLTHEQTVSLIAKAQQGDYCARDRAITGNMALVTHTVQRYCPWAQPKGLWRDVFQAGCIGLIEAVDRFDTERGVQFSTFAVSYILGRILRDQRAGLLVRVPGSERQAAAAGALSPDQMARMESALSPLSLDAQIHPEMAVTFGDTIPALANEDSWAAGADLKRALEELDERSRGMVLLTAAGHRQRTVGRAYGLSQAQVSRIVRRAQGRIGVACAEAAVC